ncbi:serine/arginine-rich splicing factor 4 [Aplysia californica]|uniref:Serine/arginine-rich splicing factor 4 n=1 Tax=Aplysia californica TaxID=6500 RepID=A0ABM0JH35_APLCA|nr:serine/arginine-rich splicing factor 4 [Aplysia californica]
MASTGDVGESLDFDFFESPRNAENGAPPPSSPPRAATSKPPTRPRPGSAKPAFHQESTRGQSDSIDKVSECNRKARSPSGSVSSRSSSSEYSSDSVSDSEDNQSQKKNQRKEKGKNSHRSSSVSSLSSTSRSRSRSRSPSRSKDKRLSRSRSSSLDDSRSKSYSESRSSKSVNDSRYEKEGRPTNPVAKQREETMPKRGRSRLGEDDYSSSAYSDEDDVGAGKKSFSNKSDSNSRRGGRASGNGSKRQAWGEDSRSDEEKPQRNRPKTAKGQRGQGSERDRRYGKGTKADSDSLSDSDMTDVSPMESPRNNGGNRQKGKRNGTRMTAAGDGGSSKMKFRAMPISDADLENEDEDPDRQKSGLDLEILMKAVGELEKQKRLQENSRRVMFAPMSLKRSDKSNYTFDKNQSRDIDRENQRLLKEIVRRVHAGEKKQQYPRGPSSYKLTASAINREREMKRIETENLAFLKRLQKVKPTKSISRDNQLQSFENTTLHGVPIGALHPMPRRGRRPLMDDSTSSIGSRTRSMTSIHSATSSVRSGGSRRSSRPSSATKRGDMRPEWSDRW